MFIPRILTSGLTVLVCSPILAADAGSFAFPSAILRITHPSWAKPFETEILQAPNHRGRVEKEFGDPVGRSTRLEPLTWLFIGKSDFGDVYIVAFANKEGGRDVVPLVFDGVRPVVVERANTRVVTRDPSVIHQLKEPKQPPKSAPRAAEY